MKRLILFVLFLHIILASTIVKAQQTKVDSLYKEYSKTTIDTTKINLLIEICIAYQDVNPAKGLSYSREALELAERLKFNKGICQADFWIGNYYREQMNNSEALKYLLKGVAAGENANDFSQLMVIYNTMGIIYNNLDEHDQSLRYFLKVAKIAEKLNKPKRLASAYNNIGIAYKDLKRYTKALEYYQLAYVEFDKTKYKRGIASVTSNLGIIYQILGDDKKALMYDELSMSTFQEMKDTASESGILTNIGELYLGEKKYQKALDYYQRAMKMAERYKNSVFKADAFDGLSKAYVSLGDYKQAFYYKNRHQALKDSIHDEEGMRDVQEMEKRLDNEKQEKEIEILKQKDEIQSLKVKSQSEKIKKSNLIIYSVAGILLIVLVMSFFIYKAYKQIQKTNSELAEKRKEIQDSINYAKNIQEAMLPDVGLLKDYFVEGFGLYLPKDIVSGDFYWFNEYNDTIYFAAADCTGHGVPGAFMSMIGIDKLNQGLIDNKIENPSDILASLNISIKKALKQKDDSSASKDGMDIALCSFNKTTGMLNYAGANRPLWILRGNEITEYKATKASIAGFTAYDQIYQGHQIVVEKGDVIFIFTDGFADQFGGPNKKKYMSKLLKQTLIDMRHLPMNKQEGKLEELFNQWRGDLEQVDDVLVLGFKV